VPWPRWESRGAALPPLGSSQERSPPRKPGASCSCTAVAPESMRPTTTPVPSRSIAQAASASIAATPQEVFSADRPPLKLSRKDRLPGLRLRGDGHHLPPPGEGPDPAGVASTSRRLTIVKPRQERTSPSRSISSRTGRRRSRLLAATASQGCAPRPWSRPCSTTRRTACRPRSAARSGDRAGDVLLALVDDQRSVLEKRETVFRRLRQLSARVPRSERVRRAGLSARSRGPGEALRAIFLAR
jgi:hypothetical protein